MKTEESKRGARLMSLRGLEYILGLYLEAVKVGM